MNDQHHATTGHRPAFRIEPATPDLGQLILTARDECVQDNNLSLGSRLMFVRILDLSVRQASNVRPGVVTISQMKLAEKFGVSERTVWNWRSELIRAGYVWMSKQWMPNAWPVDTYHVAIIHAPSNTGDKTTIEGLWGNGTRRGEPVRGLGARQPGQAQIPGTGARRKGLRLAKGFQVPVKSSNLPEIATADRKPLRLPTETGCGPQPKQVAVPHRTPLRSPTETGCGSEPQTVAVPNRNQLRTATETSCEHRKATGQGSSHIEGVQDSATSPAPPDLAVEEAIKDGDTGFADWCFAWKLKTPNHPTGEYRGKLVKELGRVRVKFQIERSAFWKRRADFLQTELDGGKPPVAKPAPVRAMKPATSKPRLSPAEQDAIREQIQRGALRAAVEAAA